MKRTYIQPGRGMPLPTVIKHTETWTPGVMFPKVYTREVRRQWTGEELRALRKSRGVGQFRRVMPAERVAA
jgi:hypothetical protein